MTPSAYIIRTANPQEVALAVDWAAAEGWNPGLNDAACYGTIDAGGFLVGLQEGEPVATISAVRYGDSFGFIGFYIVRPGHRGQGLGLKIWTAAIERLRGRTIGLDGVVAQQDNYRKSGFELAYRNIRYEGRGKDGDACEKGSIAALSQIAPEALAAYERPFFPEDRQAFIRTWISQPGATALGFVSGGILRGYGVRRLCRSGHKIGPLYADNAQAAETLFRALTAEVGKDAPIFLDVPEVNGEAIKLAERHGMTASFETARMYVGPAPTTPSDRIFGVTSFEVG